MGSISNCLAVNAKTYSNDVEIYVSQAVSQIALKQTSQDGLIANGVIMKDGRHIEADYVFSNCTPHVTFNRLLSDYNLLGSKNEKTSAFFKRIKNIDYESGVIKINLAVSRLPSFKADPNTSCNSPMPHHGCTIHFNCENMGLIDSAFQDAKYRRIPSKKPMIEMVIPSSLDPTLAPKGAHVILLFCQFYPKAIDELDGHLKQEFAQNVYNTIEQYAPGFKESIIGEDILSPTDLENIIGLTGGNIFHGAMSLNQLFINRPTGDYGSYNTPINGLYLAGSGAHPGGGVMGSPGRLSALLCLDKLNA
jgi:phytoene dehydrogenase-like protein